MDIDRDPALDKAWRAHSRETPPPALDQAILAAAHRAVASAPRKLAPEATRPPRWWMPLAAAATIGAIAIGVIQLAPPEPPGLDTGVTAPSPAGRDAQEKPATVAAPPPPAERVARMADDAKPASPAASLTQPSADEKIAAPAAKESARAVPEQEQAKKQKAASDKLVVGNAPPPPPSAPAKVAEGKAAVVPPAPAAPPLESRANKLDAQRRPEPFPDAGRKTEAMEDKRAAESSRDKAGFVTDALTTPPASAPVTTPPPQRADANKDAFRERSLGAAAPAAIPPPPAAPAPAPTTPAPPGSTGERDADAAARGGRMQPAPRASIAPQAAGAGAPSQLAKNVEVSEELRQKARDPDAWIARIRKLRDDGRTEDAQRELREFRALVPDAERRLPADLRDWKP